MITARRLNMGISFSKRRHAIELVVEKQLAMALTAKATIKELGKYHTQCAPSHVAATV